MPEPDRTLRLVDTSVWIRADRPGHDAVRARLRRLMVDGRVAICWPIRVELLVGVKIRERWVILNEQLSALDHLPVTDATWHRAARIGHDLARRGQTVPLPDLVIGAAAIEHGVPLWTVDGDFRRIAKVAPLSLDGWEAGGTA
jgi:predicted nucleic acid-binding protein